MTYSIEEVRSWFPNADDREKFDAMIQNAQSQAWQEGYVAGLNDSSLSEDSDEWHSDPYAGDL